MIAITTRSSISVKPAGAALRAFRESREYKWWSRRFIILCHFPRSIPTQENQAYRKMQYTALKPSVNLIFLPSARAHCLKNMRTEKEMWE
jgi:hypothetical protein